MSRLLVVIVCILLLYSCNTTNPIRQILKPVPPYEKYVRSLEKAELDKSAMASLWLKAGKRALGDSILVNLPFSESGYFKAVEPEARSYRFGVKEGQVLTVDAALISKQRNSKMFVDLFVWQDSAWTSLAFADSTNNLIHEFVKDQHCLLRIQPELLTDVYYTLGIAITPVLINPVAGAGNKSIGSFYGASRDGGKRSHEGVDIFAKKGTPVVAPAAGQVTRVGTSKLGGKVVWVQDRKRNHSYYFAHLEEQLVKVGVKVNQGDTLGTVGNTGNARFTPPHLHFGIYQSRAKDPINYIQTLESTARTLPWDTTFRQYAFKVITKQVNLKIGPGEKYDAKNRLKKETFVKVIAQTSDWYRVALPNKTQGFIRKSTIASIEKGKKLRVKSPAVLLSETTDDGVPVAHIESPTSVQVLAHFENYRFVKTKDGVTGWLKV